MKNDPVEALVTEHGERYRKLIRESLVWLERTEPGWHLDRPIDKTLFVRDLVEQAKKGK